MTQANYKYPFDVSGRHPNNLVKEPRTISKTIRTIIPIEGPFFTESILVKQNGKQLKRNKDFKCVYLYQEPTALTGKEICGAIKFINDKVNGEIFIEYQVVGGYYTGQRDSIEKLLNQVNDDDRLVDWESILNIPAQFMPAKHLHHRNDLIGYISMIQHLAEIRDAIENLRSRRNTQIYRLIGNTYTQLQNFIDQNKGIYDGVVSRVSSLEEKVGDSPVVPQKDFEEFKSLYSFNNDILKANIDKVSKDHWTAISRNIANISTLVKSRDRMADSIVEFRDRLNNVNINLSYIGDPNDAFMSVARSKDVFTITYELPDRLTSSVNKITSLSNKVAELYPLLSDVREINSRVTVNEGNIKLIKNDISNLQTVSNDHTRLINEHYNTLTNKINTEREDRVRAVASLDTKITELSSQSGGALDEAKVQIDAKFSSLRTELSRAIEESENDIARAVEESRSQGGSLQEQIENINNGLPGNIDNRIADHYDMTVTPAIEQAKEQVKSDLIRSKITPLANKLTAHETVHKSDLYKVYKYFEMANSGLLPMTNSKFEWWRSDSPNSDLYKLRTATATPTTLSDHTQGFLLTGKSVSENLATIRWVKNNWAHVSVDIKLNDQLADATLYMECLDYQGDAIPLSHVYTPVRNENNLSDEQLAETLIKLDSVNWSEFVARDTDKDGWVRLSAKIAPGWQRVKGETPPTSAVYAGTFAIRLILKANTNTSAQDNTRVYYVNATINPAEKPIEVKDINGFNEWLESWFAIKVRENQSAPTASRWDLSRFRVQPGAESFSSVKIDENDNVVTKGIVYYDVLGSGERALFSPTTTFNVTESTTWVVPDTLAGRMALVIVRSNSLQERTKVMHSAVRQMFVKLEADTSIPITVGDISSFGRFLTVSNAVDYNDAVYPRIESVRTATLQPGMVTIHV